MPQRLAGWAGWLAAIGLLAALAVGILGLSPDGARLRRLCGDTEAQGPDDPLFSPAGYEPEDVAHAKPAERRDGPEDAAVGAVEDGDPSLLSPPSGHRENASYVRSGRDDHLLATDPSPAVESGEVVKPRDIVDSAPADDLTGSIRVEVMGRNEQVEVLLDGESKGPTPVPLCRIQPGPHKLTFVCGDRSWDPW